MKSSFSDFKNNSDALNKKLTESLTNEGNSKKDEADPRLWYPTRGKDGNGSAVIRFLPAGPNQDIPYVKLFSYAFKNPKTGQWYIEKSRATLGEADPAAEAWWKLKNSDDPRDQEMAKMISRKVEYFYNVLVIKDPLNPENEDEVKILRGGQMWYNTIKDKAIPQFDDVESVDVFNFWKGATYRIRIKSEKKTIGDKVVDMPNYTGSTWDNPGPLFDNDEELEAVWLKEHNLQEFIDPKNFKTYDQLKARLDQVLGFTTSSKPKKEEVEEEADEAPKKPLAKSPAKVDDASDDDDGDMAFFNSLGLGTDDDDIPF